MWGSLHPCPMACNQNSHSTSANLDFYIFMEALVCIHLFSVVSESDLCVNVKMHRVVGIKYAHKSHSEFLCKSVEWEERHVIIFRLNAEVFTVVGNIMKLQSEPEILSLFSLLCKLYFNNFLGMMGPHSVSRVLPDLLHCLVSVNHGCSCLLYSPQH